VLPVLVFACIASLCWRLTAHGSAQPFGSVVLIPPPSRELGLQPTHRGGALYGRSARLGSWHIAQWNNPGTELPDLIDGQTSNGSLTFRLEYEPLTFVILHDGSALGCTGNNDQPLESDAFIGANKSAARPLPVSRFRSIFHRIHLWNDGESGADGRAPHCRISKAVGLTAVVLENSVHPSTLFYQVVLFGFETVPHSFWYRRGRDRVFGFDDTPRAYGQPMGDPGSGVQYEFDLLPRISQLIMDPTVEIDRDLSNWVIAGAYFGTSIWGHVNARTRWSGFNLVGIVR